MKSRYIEPEVLLKLSQSVPWQVWLPLKLSELTGLRVGDIVSLRKSQLQGNVLHYTAQKTGKPGTAELDESFVELLKWSTVHNNSPFFFPSPYKKGEHITRQCVWYRVKKAAEKAKIDSTGISPHTMRKVYAVETYRKHGLKAAQEALQHTRTDTTELYTKSDYLTPENLELPIRRSEIDIIVRFCVEAIKSALDKPGKP